MDPMTVNWTRKANTMCKQITFAKIEEKNHILQASEKRTNHLEANILPNKMT